MRSTDRSLLTPGVHFIKLKGQFIGILNAPFGHFKSFLFGILKANIDSINANFEYLNAKSTFMKQNKS